MDILSDQKRLKKLEAKQAVSYDKYRQREIEELMSRLPLTRETTDTITKFTAESEIDLERGTPSEPTGVYIQPAKRSAGEYASYLGSQNQGK